MVEGLQGVPEGQSLPGASVASWCASDGGATETIQKGISTEKMPSA